MKRDKPLPLKSEILSQRLLQVEILTLIKQVRRQLNRAAHEDGMSDAEFESQVLDRLQAKIEADQYVLRNYHD